MFNVGGVAGLDVCRLYMWHAVANSFFSECVTPPPPLFLPSPPPHSVPLSSDKARQSPPVPTGASYYLTYTGTQGRLALTQGKSFGPITKANKSKLEKKRTRWKFKLLYVQGIPFSRFVAHTFHMTPMFWHFKPFDGGPSKKQSLTKRLTNCNLCKVIIIANQPFLASWSFAILKKSVSWLQCSLVFHYCAVLHLAALPWAYLCTIVLHITL